MGLKIKRLFFAAICICIIAISVMFMYKFMLPNELRLYSVVLYINNTKRMFILFPKINRCSLINLNTFS